MTRGARGLSPVRTAEPVETAPNPTPPVSSAATLRDAPVRLDAPPSGALRERIAASEAVDLLIFRAGGELFATDLGAVEEAVEQPVIQPIPDAPIGLLGVVPVRDRMLPIYSPEGALRVALGGAPAAMVVLRTRGRRLGLAVDDVEDVIALEPGALRPAPGVEDADGVLLGIMWCDGDLVSVVDPEAIAAACQTESPTEVP